MAFLVNLLSVEPVRETWNSKPACNIFSPYSIARLETVQINSVCFESKSACDPPVNWWLFSLSLTLNRAPCWAAMSSWAACWSSPWPLRPTTTVQGQTPQTPATTQLLTFRRLCEHQWRMCFQCTISSFWTVTKMPVLPVEGDLRIVFAVLLPIISASCFARSFLLQMQHIIIVVKTTFTSLSFLTVCC